MADLEGIELCDPHLDIHELFSYYNDTYFEGKLDACTVAWSSLQMTLLGDSELLVCANSVLEVDVRSCCQNLFSSPALQQS